MATIKKKHPITTIFAAHLSALLWVLPMWFLLPFIHIPAISKVNFAFDTLAWAVLPVGCAITYLIAQAFFYIGMKKVSATRSGLILLIEPVAAAIIAYFLFKETISLIAAVGCGLILAAAYLTIKGG